MRGLVFCLCLECSTGPAAHGLAHLVGQQWDPGMEQLCCVLWERVSSARREALFQGAEVRWDQPDGTYCVLGTGQGLSHPVWLKLAPHGTSHFTDEESKALIKMSSPGRDGVQGSWEHLGAPMVTQKQV